MSSITSEVLVGMDHGQNGCFFWAQVDISQGATLNHRLCLVDSSGQNRQQVFQGHGRDRHRKKCQVVRWHS